MTSRVVNTLIVVLPSFLEMMVVFDEFVEAGNELSCLCHVIVTAAPWLSDAVHVDLIISPSKTKMDFGSSTLIPKLIMTANTISARPA